MIDTLKAKQNLHYIQFVPHKNNTVCCDEKHYSALAVLVNDCSLHCEKHKKH